RKEYHQCPYHNKEQRDDELITLQGDCQNTGHSKSVQNRSQPEGSLSPTVDFSPADHGDRSYIDYRNQRQEPVFPHLRDNDANTEQEIQSAAKAHVERSQEVVMFSPPVVNKCSHGDREGKCPGERGHPETGQDAGEQQTQTK